MLKHQIEFDCQEHGLNCPHLLRNQPPASIVGFRKSNDEMYELCAHNCAMVRLFAKIGLLRRSRNPNAFKSDHPCLDPQFYQDFRQEVTNNFDFYLKRNNKFSNHRSNMD